MAKITQDVCNEGIQKKIWKSATKEHKKEIWRSASKEPTIRLENEPKRKRQIILLQKYFQMDPNLCETRRHLELRWVVLAPLGKRKCQELRQIGFVPLVGRNRHQKLRWISLDPLGEHIVRNLEVGFKS